MNILFLTLVDFDSLDDRNIYTDLLRKFHQEGHRVYIISPVERKSHKQAKCIKIDEKSRILKLRIGNIQKTNLFEKGISTITLESIFISAIKKYYADVKFDLVLYSTPPITLQKAVNYVKKRDNAITYLLLKDIFPQNAVDMGMLSKHGIKGLLYRYFRIKEMKLYQDSDYIGCMSEANMKYIKRHNPQIVSDKIEICPNCIEPLDKKISEKEKAGIRKKLGVPKDKLLFVYGGNLGKPQGIPFLIECLRRIQEEESVYFLIVGSGTEYGKLRDFVRNENPENIKLLRELPVKDYERMILAADVGLIFLDYRFTIPNFPSRLLSYMQAGIPILACTDVNTDVGRIIAENGFGWWCESTDIKKFQNKIREIIADDDRKGKGITGHNYLIQNYSVDKAATIILQHMTQ